jgi:hypothetical protein
MGRNAPRHCPATHLPPAMSPTSARHFFCSRPLRRWAASMALLALAACGDGAHWVSEATPVRGISVTALQAHLLPTGTQVTCSGDDTAIYRLSRTVGTTTTVQTISCPTTLWLAGDTSLSTWTLTARWKGEKEPYAEISAKTTLPAPTVVTDGTDWVPLAAAQAQVSALPGVELVLSDASASVLARFTPADRIAASSVTADLTGATWSWRSTVNGEEFHSQEVPVFALTRTDLGFWGALAVGDTNNDGTSEFLGTLSDGLSLTSVGYDAIGMGSLFDQRVFRDVRIIDLNNDGLNDIVANVYGGGCTVIGLGRSTGGYDFQTPLRSDGSCIDGHGETILVADFDGDGQIDIVLPSYERLDYLKNQGQGVFVEVADNIGLSLPVYRPTFEGAAAVDVDLNGTVDIVLAGEVLLNDGHGHFTTVSLPFQGFVMQDEGMSVADLDGDGLYDVVKLHPVRGPRFFWGQADHTHFTDSGYLNGGALYPDEADGISTGFFTGNALPDILIAGGMVEGTPPRLCSPTKTRQVRCLTQVIPAAANTTQDLSLMTDLDGDGQAELVTRSGTLKIDKAPARSQKVFRMDLRDAQGRRTLYGLSAKAVCVATGELLQLQFVDGGNGYMAQGNYVVSYHSESCGSIWLDVASAQGLKRLGPFRPGLQQLNLTAQLLATARSTPAHGGRVKA